MDGAAAAGMGADRGVILLTARWGTKREAWWHKA